MKIKTLLRVIGYFFIKKDSNLDRNYLFRLACLLAFLAATFASIVNIIVGASWLTLLSSSILMVVYFTLYLIVRDAKEYKKWHFLSFWIGSFPFIVALWFFNAGHEGPASFILIAYMVGIICIFPKNLRIIFTNITLFTVVALVYIEYHNPSLILKYESPNDWALDYGLTFIIVGGFIAIIINTFARSYDLERSNLIKEREKTLEASLIIQKQNTDLHNHNLLKDRLFATLSHDLRSPLNALKGTLVLIDSQQLTEDELKRVSKNISERLENTSALLDNLLDWSNAQLSGISLSTKTIGLERLLKECVNVYEFSLNQKEIGLNLQIPPHHQILADSEMIKSIFRNLISNAVKFTPKGGEIKIISIAAENGKSITIEFHDTGIGMNSERIQSLFEYKLNSTEGTEKEKGAGIGLLITKQFIEKNGGRLIVSSQVGKGSCFSVELPSA